MANTGGCATEVGQRWRCRSLAACLILATAAARIVYLAYYCPLDLAPDEAHYWDWSRHLDWSYYSKGPLIAYLIRISCALAGGWSEQLTASQMLAVRLPAVVCGGLLLVSLYILTVQVFARERLALGVVAIALTVPVVQAGASLMTIDAPYTCLWGWALVLGYQAIFRQSRWAWPLLGLVIGLGILAKYTMVLWIPAAGLFLLTSTGYRRLLLGPGFWIMTALAAACCLPILIWNMQHDWLSLRHVSGQAGLDRAEPLWLGPLEFIGSQALLLLVFWFIGWARAMAAYCPWKAADAGVRYLWWMSTVMFGVFLLFSLKTHEEPNWPVTAYLSGIVLTAAWLAKQLQSAGRSYRRLTWACVIAACTLGSTVTLAMFRSDWVEPALVGLAGEPTAERPTPLRRFDPTCRLRGWRELATIVDELRHELRQEGIEPVVTGTQWNLPGELAFYCEGNPTVYTLGLALGDRHSQYELWQPNPVSNPEAFVGHTFIFVGEIRPLLRASFERVDASRHVIINSEGGQPIAKWCVTVCRGFRGFPASSAVATNHLF
ncbi:MAG TPA: glycosyltransferase family 39 protein [Gemmataceae bacterium]|nr:glycosyltransferase family 39 protein [Gemmataceae bacterium]